MKICGTCKIEKDYSEFNKRTKSKDGYASMCRKCNTEYQKKYNRENRDNLTIKQKIWKDNNKEQYKNKRKIYLQKNKEKIKQQQSEYYLQNKEYFRELGREYYENNKDRFTEYGKKQYKIKYNNDILYTLKIRVRRRLGMFFINKNKKGSTREMLGCSWEYLKTHLESQFTEGMNWNNHGQFGWHIDHIIPLASAKTEEEVYKLCHYTNLQPLWWRDNIQKSDKIIEYQNHDSI